MRLFDAIFNNTTNGLLLTDHEGVIQRVNDTFLRRTGYVAADLVGKPAGFFDTQEDYGEHFQESLWDALHEQGEWRGRIWNRAKNGKLYASWLKVVPITDVAITPEIISNAATQTAPPHNAKRTILHYLGIYSEIDIHDEESLEARHQAINYDSLTHLPNVLLFKEKLIATQALMKRYATRFAVLYVSLDRFSPINSLLGYPIGDELLRQVSERLLNRVRQVDMLARVGGDEFVMVLADIKTLADVSHVARNVLRWLQMPFSIQSHTLTVAVHLGISVYPDDSKEVDTLIGQAKEAMLRARHTDNGEFCFYTNEEEMMKQGTAKHG